MATAVPDNGPIIVGVTWTLLALCGAFLGTRIYAKTSRHQGLWWDDWILIFSWCMLLAESIITQYGQTLGFGKHAADIQPVANVTTIAMNTSIAASISCLASTSSKISFGVTLLRLTKGWWRKFVWFCIITLFVVMIPSVTNTWLQCTPVTKAFNSAIDGYCWDSSITVNYGIFNAAWCTVVDFALALLPWKLIIGLQMKTREKIGVSVAMSLGILSGVCAIVKGIYVVQLREEDFSYNGMDVTIWTATETATAIIAASVPVLRVLFKEKLSTRGYNMSSGRDVPLSTVRGTKRGTLTSHSPKGPSGGWSTTVTAKEDDESDRSILRDEKINTNAGILQTHSYVIDFHQADSASVNNANHQHNQYGQDDAYEESHRQERYNRRVSHV